MPEDIGDEDDECALADDSPTPVSPVSAGPAAQTSPTRTWPHIPAAQARFIRNTRSAIDSGQRVDLFNDWTAIRPSFPVLEEVEGAAGTFEQNMKKAASTYEYFGGTTGLGSLAPTPFAVGAKEGQLGHAKGGGGGGNGAGNVGERAASTRATSCLGPIAGSLASGAASKKTTVNVGTSVPLVLVATSTPPRPSPPPAAAAAVPAATILSLLSIPHGPGLDSGPASVAGAAVEGADSMFAEEV